MRVVVLYRPNSEHSRWVEAFAQDLEKQFQASIDLLSLDTREGVSTASLYDVVQHPAVLVLGNDGQLVRDWQGNTWPLMSEITYYSKSGS